MSKKEKQSLVTLDTALIENQKMAPADVQLLKDIDEGKGHVIESIEEFNELVTAANDAKDFFDGMIDTMTMDKAEIVKKLRLDGHTWRSVALECFNLGWGEWWPTSNQLMGMALCEKAAKMFDEDYMKPPWNG